VLYLLHIAVAYVSWRCNSSCCAVFIFDVHVEIYVGSEIATRLRPLLCGCWLNGDLAGFVVSLIPVRGMQVIVYFFVFFGSHR
jgi:hypothetical protein